jgi:hypothetical protein
VKAFGMGLLVGACVTEFGVIGQQGSLSSPLVAWPVFAALLAAMAVCLLVWPLVCWFRTHRIRVEPRQ